MKFLKELSEIAGAPGREERVRGLLKAELQGVADELVTDAMGNLLAWRRATSHTGPGRPKRIMLACHMDEIAFYVRHIDKRGFLRLQHLGGFDPRNLLARRVRIQTRTGDLLGNLNLGKPIHIQTPEDRKRPPSIKDLFVDTGLPADEVLSRVKPGDPVTLVGEFIELGDTVSGKSMDNRVACWVGVRVMEAMAKFDKLAYDVCVCFTVQEEIGIRGAQTATFQVEPDLGFAVDVTLAVDHPGSSEEDQITALGDGVALKIMDSASISDRALVDELIDLAEAKQIPYQMELLPLGGTDAAALQRSRAGCRVMTLSVPCRYVHTITETVHKDDLKACVDLLVAYIGQN